MCRGRLRYLEKLKTAWWKRWQEEYLGELREVHTRGKVSNQSKVAAPGDVVLLRNENLPRGSWRLGTITEVIPGKDDTIRTAKLDIVKPDNRGKKKRTDYVRTSLNRSPSYLVPLEVNERD